MTPGERARALADELGLPTDIEQAIAEVVADAERTMHEHYFDQRLRLSLAETLLERVLALHPDRGASHYLGSLELHDTIRAFLERPL